MKSRHLLILLVISAILACPSAHLNAETGRTYLMGILLTSAPNEDTRFITYFTDALGIISKRENFSMELKTYDDHSEFMEALKTRELDFTASLKRDVILDIVDKHGYTPFVTATLYKRKKSRNCIYVKSTESTPAITDLSKKSLSFDGGLDTYLDLRTISGEKPEQFFKLMKAPNPSAAIYDLSLGRADACLANDLHMDFIKMTNPAPVKDFTAVACTPYVINAPFCYSDRVSPDLIASISSMLANARNDDDFKRYRPLMKTAGINFFPVSPADYSDEFQRLKNDRENGYISDHKSWLSSLEPEK